jgi:hypothetical protein
MQRAVKESTLSSAYGCFTRTAVAGVRAQEEGLQGGSATLCECVCVFLVTERLLCGGVVTKTIPLPMHAG